MMNEALTGICPVFTHPSVDVGVWYVLFVKTGFEDVVRRQLSNFPFHSDIEIFNPTKEQFVKLPSGVKKETKVMYPGYLFIETKMDTMEFVRHINQTKCDLQKILKLLRYDSGEYAVSGAERKLLDALFDKARCLTASVGVIEGDRIIVMEGPLVGYESIIRRIDRHKRKATIEVQLFGVMRNIDVALEIVEKLY